MLKGRKNREAFKFFCNNFLIFIDKTKYKKKCHIDKVLIGDIFTVSDEAFALLTLENNWRNWYASAADVWMDEYAGILDEDKRHHWKMDQYMAFYSKEEQEGGEIPGLEAINRSKKYTSGDSDGRNKGWSQRGMERFQELIAMVKDDRKQENRRVQQERTLKHIEQEIKDELSGNRGKKRKRNSDQHETRVAMYDDGFMDESDDNDNDNNNNDDSC
jgi:hypothetical protein